MNKTPENISTDELTQWRASQLWPQPRAPTAARGLSSRLCVRLWRSHRGVEPLLIPSGNRWSVPIQESYLTLLIMTQVPLSGKKLFWVKTCWLSFYLSRAQLQIVLVFPKFYCSTTLSKCSTTSSAFKTLLEEYNQQNSKRHLMNIYVDETGRQYVGKLSN